MPIVVTDFTNKTWAVEQPNDGYLHVGYTGQPGPRLLDILDFVGIRQKQFDKFVAKRRAEEADAKKRRHTGDSVRENPKAGKLQPAGGRAPLTSSARSDN